MFLILAVLFIASDTQQNILLNTEKYELKLHFYKKRHSERTKSPSSPYYRVGTD